MSFIDLSNERKINYAGRFIYYLINDGNIVYVGQSISLLMRISAHTSSSEKEFNSVRVSEVSSPVFLNDAEFIQILINKPKYNLSLPTPTFLITALELKTRMKKDEACGVTDTIDSYDLNNSEYTITINDKTYNYWFNKLFISLKSRFDWLVGEIDKLERKS